MAMQITWTDTKNGDWHIYAGPSQFLVAEGPGWSKEFGRALYLLLTFTGQP